MRKTKIVCTIGPSSDNEKTLTEMIQNGMNVARFNMSHGDIDEQTKRIELIRKLSDKYKKPIAILIDTKGPECRVKTFSNGFEVLEENSIFTFCCDDIDGDRNKVSVTHTELYEDVKPGDTILVNDGLLEFCVQKIEGKCIECKIIKGGKISNRKGMNFPNLSLSLPYISDVDKKDILFAIKIKADFLAASFVSNPENVKELRAFLLENGGASIDIISKIENADGVKNIDNIIGLSDGIMVARGDMGVEIPFEKLPGLQKKLIKKTRFLGKRVITATEMLESMIESPRPTRAEASDVANAVFDGTSAIMLSGETAMGKYPALVVKTMSKIAEEAECNINYGKRFKEINVEIRNTADAISKATCDAAIDLHAKLIIVFTKSGSTARMVSRFRPSVPIIAATFDGNAYTKLAMNWGVMPIITKKYSSTDDLFELANDIAKIHGDCKAGDIVAITAGMPIGSNEGTNILKIIKVK